VSVIPFILNGNNRTVVNNRNEYQNTDGINGDVICIENLDADQILDIKSSNVSYDLRVGDEFRDHRELGKTDLFENSKICLQPGSAVIIQTAEFVRFPKSRFGHIVPKVSLLQDGLSNTSSKIDPGYEGHLLITVFNLGKRTIELKKGQKFCTLYVLDIKGDAIPYQGNPKRIVGNSKKNLFGRIRDFVEVNQTYFTVLLTIATLILTVVTIVSIVQS